MLIVIMCRADQSSLLLFILQYVLSYCERCVNNENSDDVIGDVVAQLRNEELCLGFTLKLLVHAVSQPIVFTLVFRDQLIFRRMSFSDKIQTSYPLTFAGLSYRLSLDYQLLITFQVS